MNELLLRQLDNTNDCDDWWLVIDNDYDGWWLVIEDDYDDWWLRIIMTIMISD